MKRRKTLPLVVGPSFGPGMGMLRGWRRDAAVDGPWAKPSWAQVHGKGFNMGSKRELTSGDG